MLDDGIVLANCYYWAKRMVCKGIDFNALISVGYIVGKPLKDPRLLKDWIHFTMLKYITDEIKNRSKCINIDDTYIQNIREAKDNPNYSDLYSSVHKAKLTAREKEVVRLCFYQGLTQKEAGECMGVKQQTICVHVNTAISKIRRVYLKGVER